MKTLPLFWRNQFYRIAKGAVFYGLCLSSYAQNSSLETPAKTDYPGTIETFEKLIQIDNDKINTRTSILEKAGKVFQSKKDISNLDLEPDFLNSIILHSDPGYLRMASTNRCRFYESILTDLLKSSEGKINNILITYVEENKRYSSIINKKEFLNKVIYPNCPETKQNIDAFQVKTIKNTLNGINFEFPTDRGQCHRVHLEWLNNSKTPFLCQIHEYINEAKKNEGDPKTLSNRKAVAKVLEEKISLNQRDYLKNLCTHLDEEKIFCDQFLNVSFWTKISSGLEDKFYAKGICQKIIKSKEVSENQYQQCLSKLKQEQDLCLYPYGNPGLRPQPECDLISKALNHSSFSGKYDDCPGLSDQFAATNISRIISHFTPSQILQKSGVCSGTSSASIYNFNKKYDNDENWGLEACYEDRLIGREVCHKTYFAENNSDPASYTSVVKEILKKTRGTDYSLNCSMIKKSEYNPTFLKYKSGCFIVVEDDQCYISRCKHKIILNDRSIDFVKIKGEVLLDYFPVNINKERFSQNFILTRDYKRSSKSLRNLSTTLSYLKKSQNKIIHGIGCAEELLPSFFKAKSINQCSPLPFIISGIIKSNDNTVFVIRTSVDSIQAPRLISWSLVYSAVKSYQAFHPLKTWTLYGLD